MGVGEEGAADPPDTARRRPAGPAGPARPGRPARSGRQNRERRFVRESPIRVTDPSRRSESPIRATDPASFCANNTCECYQLGDVGVGGPEGGRDDIALCIIILENYIMYYILHYITYCIFILCVTFCILPSNYIMHYILLAWSDLGDVGSGGPERGREDIARHFGPC